MRIEVEVYDGPLSKTLAIQKKELQGVVDVTVETMALLIREFHLSQCRLGCFGRQLDGAGANAAAMNYCAMIDTGGEALSLWKGVKPTLRKSKHAASSWEKALNDSLKTTRNGGKIVRESIFPDSVIDQYPQIFSYVGLHQFDQDTNRIRINKEDKPLQVCPVLNDIKLAMADIYAGMEELSGKALNDEYFSEVARYGAVLSEGAEQWAAAQIAIIPESKRMKIVVARASMASVELGNDLSARADAILRQTNNSGTPILPELLATSHYLRNSGASDYLNLVDWMDAKPRNEKRWDATDRTRMVERLISDANWSKVNEAFAQGKGDVSMAFVKDSIGNWNLKSYDNDPSELLQAYKDVGSALLSSAADLAGGGSLSSLAKNIAGVKENNKLANEVLIGTGGIPSSSVNTVSSLESRVQERLKAVGQILIDRSKALREKLLAFENQVAEQSSEISENEDSYKIQSDKRKVATEKVNAMKYLYEHKMVLYETANKDFLDTDDTPEDKKAAKKAVRDDALQAEKKEEEELRLSEKELAEVNNEIGEDIANHEAKIAALAKVEGQRDQVQAAINDEPMLALARIQEILEGHADMLEGFQVSLIDAQKKSQNE